MIDYVLSDIFALFMDGFVIGGLLTGFPFIIGLAINALYRFMQK